MKGELIGEGNTAEIYQWGEREILKLFRQDYAQAGVEKEYRNSQKVQECGLPVPKVGSMIQYEGRSGIIYEYIQGTSMLDLLLKQPLSLKRNIAHFAALHYEIHQCKAEGLSKYKDILEWNIRHAKQLSEEEKQLILARLQELPDGEALCHGDYHPGNVIRTNDKSMILDWMTAAAGSPSADVARTTLLFMAGNLPSGGLARYFTKKIRKYIAKVYQKQYMKLSGMSIKEINGWRLPIMAARLVEWIPENEAEHFLEEIRRELSLTT